MNKTCEREHELLALDWIQQNKWPFTHRGFVLVVDGDRQRMEANHHLKYPGFHQKQKKTERY